MIGAVLVALTIGLLVGAVLGGLIIYCCMPRRKNTAAVAVVEGQIWKLQDSLGWWKVGRIDYGKAQLWRVSESTLKGHPSRQTLSVPSAYLLSTGQLISKTMQEAALEGVIL